MLAAPDEDAVKSLAATAILTGMSATVVTEPDIDDQVTAVALEPHPAARRLCANLPLLLKESAMS